MGMNTPKLGDYASKSNDELLAAAKEAGDALHCEMAHRIRILTTNLKQSESREGELVQTRLYLEREIQDLGRQVTAQTVGSEDRRPNLPTTPKYPVADWQCGVCGWIGNALTVMEVSHRHYDWNKSRGKSCSGVQARQ